MDQLHELKLDYEKENGLSKIFFWWILPLIRLGKNYTINPQNFIMLPPQASSELLGVNFSKYWESELKSNKPRLEKAVFLSYCIPYFKIVLLYMFRDAVCRMGQGPCILLILKYLNGSAEFQTGVWGAIFLITFVWLNGTITQVCMFQSLQLGMQIRVALTSVVYNKILRLPNEVLNDGQIMNLISNHVNRFDRLVYQSVYLFTTPVQFLVLLELCLNLMGTSILLGLGLCVLGGIFQFGVIRLFRKVRKQCVEKSAIRIRLVTEVIKCIQQIKISGWEETFKKMIYSAISEESTCVFKRAALALVGSGITEFLLKLTLPIMIAMYQFNGNEATACKVFVLSCLMTYFGTSITNNFPLALAAYFECIASCEMLQTFLQTEDRFTNSISCGETNEIQSSGNKDVVQLQSVTCTLHSRNMPVLSNINFTLEKGCMMGIVGPVGSGKSTLLKAIVGEVKFSSGRIGIWAQKVAHVTQDPWIFPATILENIIFGRPFCKSWFDQVIEACALGPDLAGMPNGENEVIGDRGITLSGGQKSRINLARAVYADADLYLLDDPLSAVDVKVARIIVEKCIQGLLKSKSIILVTHQIQYLCNAQSIISLKDGRVEMCGTFEDVLESRYCGTEEKEEPNVNDLADFKIESMTELNEVTNHTENKQSTHRQSSTKVEENQSSSIEFNLHWKYWTSGGLSRLILVISLVVLSQVVSSAGNYWLKFWLGGVGTHTAEVWGLQIYIAHIVAFGVISNIRNITFAIVGKASGNALHKRMIASLLRTKMKFYQLNDSGKIINRVVSDIGIIDDSMLSIYTNTITSLFRGLGAIILIGILCPPLFLPGILMLILICIVRNYYVTAGISFKRAESLARSPVFSIFNSTLNGLATIRGSKSESIMIQRFNHIQDAHSAAYFCQVTATRWYASTLDWITTLYNISVVVYIVFFEQIDAASAGLILSSTTNALSYFAIATLRSSELENALLSIERVLEYINLESEENKIRTEIRPRSDWPRSGYIEFNRVFLRYGTNPPILKDINLKINSNETIGVVGRTGAGKSSLVSALFRLEELCNGTITLDDVDISKIGLHDLRTQLVMVQQNPLLFRGSLRGNLDPLESTPDKQLWAIIKELQLERRFNTPNGQGLDTQISDCGENLSVGERQLIALGRALIPNAKVLILDEATASIDNRTDVLVQKVIQNKFQGRTKIIIAHRLSSVMKCDKIAVLDAGELIEFDHPHILLQNKNGHLYRLIEGAGMKVREELRKAAKISYENKSKSQSE